MFERLTGEPIDVLPALQALAELATDDRPHTFFNFVATLDGRAAVDGSSRPLGDAGDLEMLLSLRTAADAVLIGPGTVRAEGYGRLVGPDRRPEPPIAVLISRSFTIPWKPGCSRPPTSR